VCLPPLTSPDQVSVAIRIPTAVICLIPALAQYGLTNQVPHAVDVALPSHAQIPKLNAIPLRVFWCSDPALSARIDVISIDQVPLRAYRGRTRKPDYQALSRFAKVDRGESDAPVPGGDAMSGRDLGASVPDIAPPQYSREHARRDGVRVIEEGFQLAPGSSYAGGTGFR
jgi:hypothetical protein